MSYLTGGPDSLMTTGDVAALLNTPENTVRWWRHQGEGPKAFKLGPRKVMYRRGDVEEWIRARMDAAS